MMKKTSLLNQQTFTVEQALVKAGNGHSFQRRVLLFIAIQFFLAGALKMCIGSLFMQQPSPNRFPCKTKVADQPHLRCTDKEYCAQDYDYQPEEEFGPITREYDLICTRSLMGQILVAAFYLGGSMGSLYYGEQQEYRQGRYKIMLESLLLMGLSCCACVIAPSLYFLSVGFFCVNFFQRGFFNASLILFFEISSENLQKIGPPLLLFSWGLGEMIVPIFSYHWKIVMLILTGIPLVASSILMSFIKESPRFLVIKKQFERAKIIIQEIAFINERPMPSEWVFEDEVKINQLREKMANIIQSNEISTEARSYNYSVLFRYNSTRVRTTCLLYLYVVFTFAQFLTSREILAISRLGTIKTFLFLGVAETLGYLGSAYASLNQPRKPTLKNVIILSAIFCLIDALWPLIFITSQEGNMGIFDHLGYTLRIMVLIMARICLSFGFSYLNVYVLEVFPTSVRHYALSFLVFTTEFVFIFFESYLQLCYALGINRQIGMSLALLLGLTTMQKLRETFNVPLKENLDEFQEDLLNNQVYT